MDLLQFAEICAMDIDNNIEALLPSITPPPGEKVSMVARSPFESKVTRGFIEACKKFKKKFYDYLASVKQNQKPDRKKIIAFVLGSSCMTLEMFKLSISYKEEFIEEAEKEMRHFINVRLFSNELGDERITLADLSEPVSIEGVTLEGVSLEPLRLHKPTTPELPELKKSTDNFIYALFEKYGYLNVLIYVANKYGIGNETTTCFLEAARGKGDVNVDALSLVLSVLQGDEVSAIRLLKDDKVKQNIDKGIGFKGIKYTPLYYAILTRNEKMVRILLEYGATKLREGSEDKDFAKDCKPLFGEVDDAFHKLFLEARELFMLDMLKPEYDARSNLGSKMFRSKEKIQDWQWHLSPQKIGELSIEKLKKLFPKNLPESTFTKPGLRDYNYELSKEKIPNLKLEESAEIQPPEWMRKAPSQKVSGSQKQQSTRQSPRK